MFINPNLKLLYFPRLSVNTAASDHGREQTMVQRVVGHGSNGSTNVNGSRGHGSVP